MNQQIYMLQKVAAVLAAVPQTVVFTGGATISLYLDDVSASDIRPTLDVDCGVEISSRSEYYQFSELLRSLINIFKIGEYDVLLNDLHDCKPNVVLVDLPGTSGEAFEQMEEELALFEQAKLLGYRITMMVVMSRTKDSIDALEQLMKYCDDKKRNINYVAVLNLFFGNKEKFTRWQNSDTKTTFEPD